MKSYREKVTTTFSYYALAVPLRWRTIFLTQDHRRPLLANAALIDRGERMPSFPPRMDVFLGDRWLRHCYAGTVTLSGGVKNLIGSTGSLGESK